MTGFPRVSQARDRLTETPLELGAVLPYPWAGLEAAIRQAPSQKLLLVGYGSLINQASAARTLRTRPDERFPCLAFGCRRVFNYQMPAAVLKRYGEPEGSARCAALNVEVTGDLADAINGVIVSVDEQDVPALRDREFGYDLKPVACLRWDVQEGGAPFVAYVLSAPEKAARSDWQVVNTKILPQPQYAKLCQDGADSISPEFGECYLKSTFFFVFSPFGT